MGEDISKIFLEDKIKILSDKFFYTHDFQNTRQAYGVLEVNGKFYGTDIRYDSNKKLIKSYSRMEIDESEYDLFKNATSTIDIFGGAVYIQEMFSWERKSNFAQILYNKKPISKIENII